jgi:sulfur carrier protein
VKVALNGRETELPEGCTVAALVERMGLAGRPVAVERNREVVPRARHADTALAEGDRLEVVALVGGG